LIYLKKGVLRPALVFFKHLLELEQLPVLHGSAFQQVAAFSKYLRPILIQPLCVEKM
jgi:hypothetical protein